VVLGDNENIDCDIVILATEVRLNLDMFRDGGIDVDDEGIMVDTDMTTSVQDVLACGDCARCFSVIDKLPLNAKLATIAIKQGMVAGANAAGGEILYPGTVAPYALVLGELEVASVGLNARMAVERGYDIKQVKKKGRNIPVFIPEGKDITVKMVFDKKSRRLLGAQAIGGDGTIARIDHLGIAIASGVTVDDLYLMELSYTPPRSEGTDIILKVAEFAKRKLR